MTLTTESEMSEPTIEELQRRVLEQQVKQNDQNERRAEEMHRAELAAIQGPPKDPATGMSTNPSVTRLLRSIHGVNASLCRALRLLHRGRSLRRRSFSDRC
jgi:hypothetical protein